MLCIPEWRDGRVAEGARLESVYRLIPYRGFESPSLRHPSPQGDEIGETLASALFNLIRVTRRAKPRPLQGTGGAALRILRLTNP